MGILIRRILILLFVFFSLPSLAQDYFPKLSTPYEKLTFQNQSYAIEDGRPKLLYLKYTEIEFSGHSSSADADWYQVPLNCVGPNSSITFVLPSEFFHTTWEELGYFMLDNHSAGSISHIVIGVISYSNKRESKVSELYAVFYNKERGMISFLFDANHPKSLKSCAIATSSLEKYSGISFYSELPSSVQVLYKSFANVDYFEYR